MTKQDVLDFLSAYKKLCKKYKLFITMDQYVPLDSILLEEYDEEEYKMIELELEASVMYEEEKEEEE